jgi:hypothetical protein
MKKARFVLHHVEQVGWSSNLWHQYQRIYSPQFAADSFNAINTGRHCGVSEVSRPQLN